MAGLDAATQRKLIIGGVAGGLAAGALAFGALGRLNAVTGGSAAIGTGVIVFGSVVITEYLLETLMR